MKLKFILTFLTIFFSLDIAAQNNEHPAPEPEKHEHHKNEIGFDCSPLYFFKEKTTALGLHLHYTRNIPNTKIGLGLGYEQIFDPHKHKTIGIVAAYTPADRLILSISPGLAFEIDKQDPAFAIHLEASYEFEIKNILLGPVIGFAMEQEDYHISLGLHIGYGF